MYGHLFQGIKAHYWGQPLTIDPIVQLSEMVEVAIYLSDNSPAEFDWDTYNYNLPIFNDSVRAYSLAPFSTKHFPFEDNPNRIPKCPDCGLPSWECELLASTETGECQS